MVLLHTTTVTRGIGCLQRERRGVGSGSYPSAFSAHTRPLVRLIPAPTTHSVIGWLGSARSISWEATLTVLTCGAAAGTAAARRATAPTAATRMNGTAAAQTMGTAERAQARAARGCPPRCPARRAT